MGGEEKIIYNRQLPEFLNKMLDIFSYYLTDPWRLHIQPHFFNDARHRSSIQLVPFDKKDQLYMITATIDPSMQIHLLYIEEKGMNEGKVSYILVGTEH